MEKTWRWFGEQDPITLEMLRPNGAGKSTLLKIVSGIYIPDSGKVVVNGDLVPFLELA